LIVDEKIRLRTKEELKVQNDGLINLKKIFDEVNLTYFLSSGTLLGAVRDNDFIPWDWDVQMYLLTEEAFPLKYKLSKLFLDNKFIIHKFNDTCESLKWDLRKNSSIFELTAWYEKGKWRYRKNKSMRVPAYLFKGEYKIYFKEVEYKTLNTPEEYLEFCYGDWRTPLRTSNKEIYSTSNHLRKYSFTNKIFSILKKILKKIY
jgi:phosphorylcholine metabolism protein LicD